jgi:adenylate kinase
MLNIVLLGPPGSGKGTQSALLSSKLNIVAISTGDLLRNEVSEKTEIGLLAKSYIDVGSLVPDDVVMSIVKNKIQDLDNGFILDGFPRNVEQAIKLDSALVSIKKNISAVLNFVISDDEVVKRISGRFFCKKCGAIYNKFLKNQEELCDKCGEKNYITRADDTDNIIRNRLKVYHESMKKLIDFFAEKNLIYSIPSVKSSPLIFEECLKILKNLKQNG